MRRHLLIVLLIALLSHACASTSEKKAVPTSSPPGPSATAAAPKSFKDVPKDFPQNFPLPKDGGVVYAATGSGQGGTFFWSARSVDDLTQFFLTELPPHGWQIANCARAQRGGAQVVIILATYGGRIVRLGIGHVPDLYPDVNTEFSFHVEFTSGAAPTSAPDSSCK